MYSFLCFRNSNLDGLVFKSYMSKKNNVPVSIEIPLKTFAIVFASLNGYSGTNAYLLMPGAEPSESKITVLAKYASGITCTFDNSLNKYYVNGLNIYGNMQIICCNSVKISQQ